MILSEKYTWGIIAVLMLPLGFSACDSTELRDRQTQSRPSNTGDDLEGFLRNQEIQEISIGTTATVKIKRAQVIAGGFTQSVDLVVSTYSSEAGQKYDVESTAIAGTIVRVKIVNQTTGELVDKAMITEPIEIFVQIDADLSYKDISLILVTPDDSRTAIDSNNFRYVAAGIVDEFAYLAFFSQEPELTILPVNNDVDLSSVVIESKSNNTISAGNQLVCPSDHGPFVLIKGATDPGSDPNDFCIAKYEMKPKGLIELPSHYDANLKAVSRATGKPWSVKQTEAIEQCQGLGEGYDLISNAQWNTVAREVESIEKNWENNDPIDGQLPFGLSLLAEANEDDNISCYLTINNTTCSLSEWNIRRRIVFVKSGGIVWDLVANAHEWIKDIMSKDDYGDYPQNLSQVAPENNTKFGPLGDHRNGSAPNYKNIGSKISLDIDASATEIFTRGKMEDHSYSSGIFSILPRTSLGTAGFRCVYRKPAL